MTIGQGEPSLGANSTITRKRTELKNLLKQKKRSLNRNSRKMLTKKKYLTIRVRQITLLKGKINTVMKGRLRKMNL